MKINERIKARRLELNMSLEDVARLVGCNRSTIYKYENGNTEKLPIQILAPLAVALRCSPTYLMGLEDEMCYSAESIKFVKVPLYSPICCGNGGFAEDNIIEYIPVPGDGLNVNKEYFAQYAKGNSMADRIEDGDLLVFEKTSVPEVNKIGCFCVDENEAMCKQYKVSNGVPILVPLNREYEPIVVDSTNFRCIGLLKKVIKNF